MPPRKTQIRHTRSKASSSKAEQSTTDIYQDLIAEATSETDFYSNEERPLKRRKPISRETQGSKIEPVTPDKTKGKGRQHAADIAIQPPQALDDRHLDHASDDDDLAFEDVDISHGFDEDADDSDEELEDINITLGQQPHHGTPSSIRRKPTSRTEKAGRVLAHKAHLVALLGHCMIVNSRCNDRKVHGALRHLLTTTVRQYLRPNRSHTQFQQDRTFNIGLERAAEAFRDAYQVNALSMMRPHWHAEAVDVQSVDAPVLDRDQFIDAARTMSGSQDTGNQLFCALLRAAGVRARLVCSLQVLPIANIAPPATPVKSPKPVVFAIAPDTPIDRPSNDTLSIKERAVVAARSRIGQPAFRSQRVPTVTTSPTTNKAYHKLAYPTFWTEVLNVAYQKWVPIDPVVTQTINRASKLEPPLSYPINQLVYAVAFSRKGSAKDVTRRYARAYNAKTRRMRLESVSDADTAWLRKVMRIFAKRTQSDADMIEETEMAQRVAREGLPANIQDFKGHPVYALERHLRRHEVVHPRREVGKANAGTAAKPRMEPIFRREDVHVCRSAEQWYRHGRMIKAGEQSSKLVPARSRAQDSGDESDHQEPNETALYILSQTELYIPKPVVRGRVPQNAFGNLDIYVPSMIPRGGSHIRHPLAKTAAAILQIDAVDAVTGFKFARRKASTVIEGAVVPEQYAEAVQAVIEGLLWQEVDERNRARSALAMRMWKHLLQGLKIAERVASYATEVVPTEPAIDGPEMSSSTAWYDAEEEPLHTAGQYTLDELVHITKASKKKKVIEKRRVLSEDENADHEHENTEDEIDDEHTEPPSWAAYDGNGDGDQGGGFLPDSPRSSSPAAQSHSDYGDGFVIDADDDTQQSPHPVDGNEATGHTHHNRFSHGAEPLPGASGNLDSYSTSDSELLPVKSIPETDHPIPTSLTTTNPSTVQHDPQTIVVDASDEGSLLSHDPEDDDAEPDWMESERSG